MAVHDVSKELRGPHGEWARGGSVLHRLAGEAKAQSEGKGSGGDIHSQVSGVVKGTGRTIGGHRIDRTQKDKYRVGLKTSSGRDTRLYDTPADAAKAISEGNHHEGGASSAFRKVTGQAPKEEAKAPEAKPEPSHVPKPAGPTTEHLMAKAREMQAAEKARVEAENVATGRAGSTTISRPMGGVSASTKGKKVSVSGLPSGYSVHESSRKNYMDQPIREIHHPTQGHIADLVPITESVPQNVRGNVAYGGFKERKGYNYKLVHPEVVALSKAERKAAAKSGSAYLPGYLESRLTQSMGAASSSAVKTHELLLKRARSGSGHG